MRFLGEQSTLISLTFRNCPIGDEHVRELCGLPRLSFLSLEGTPITDAALEYLAKLPKLEFLNLDRTQITGEGLRHFADYPALKTLYVSETHVTDATIAHAARIPNLSIMRFARTRISPAGLLALAIHPKLKVNADQQFTPEQYAEFEAAQRRLAKERDKSVAVSPQDIDAAKAVLTGFFAAMLDWERKANAAGSGIFSPENKARKEELIAKCQEIFAKHCTAKPRAGGRPDNLICGSPPAYENVAIVDVEPVSKQKLFFHTREARDHRRRYLMIRAHGEWRLDHREWFADGWKRDYV